MSKNIFSELSESIANAVEQAATYTVLVDARKRLPASGIVITKDIVLTASHVVERDEDINVILANGTDSKARLIGRDVGTDLAVVKLDSPSTATAEVVKVPARAGHFVLAIGRTSKDKIQSSFGTVIGLEGPVRTGRGGMLEQYIKTDFVSYPGFSGGPLINGESQVLGINTSGFGGGAITIPMNIAQKIADALIKDGKIKRGYLGIRSQTVNIPADAKSQLKREQDTALLIVGIEKDSPAEKDGLIIGDILVGVNGVAIEHHDELFSHLSGDVVGKSTPMNVLRGGQLQVVNVTVGER